MVDDKMEILEVDEDHALEIVDEKCDPTSKQSLEKDMEQSMQDKIVDAQLSETGKVELMNILNFYSNNIKTKPNYIKDYFFKNGLIKPVVTRIVKPYPVPYKLLKKAKATINDMVKAGILVKVSGASHTHPGFFGKKPNRELRLLINAVYLNEFLARKAVHIPSIDDLLYQVGENMFFTSLDQIGAYNQLRLDPEFFKYVCIVFPWGVYMYLRMPQGLKTSVEAYQGVMVELFGHLEFILICLDDLLIFST